MGVIRRQAQGHIGDICYGCAYMHAHAGTFPAHPVHSILTSTRLILDTNVTAIAILTEFVVLWHLALHFLACLSRLLSLPSTTSTSSSSRTATATAPLVATPPAGAIVRNGLGLCSLWLGRLKLLILLKLLPGRRDKVYI